MSLGLNASKPDEAAMHSSPSHAKIAELCQVPAVKLHAFRILLRRVQADLELLEPLFGAGGLRPLRRRVRRLLKKSSGARDAQVEARSFERLGAEARPPHSGPCHAGSALRRRMEGVKERRLKALARLLREPIKKAAASHRVRLTIKRLRYSLEGQAHLLGEPPPGGLLGLCQEAQESLGRRRDLDLALEALPRRGLAKAEEARLRAHGRRDLRRAEESAEGSLLRLRQALGAQP